MRTLAPLHTNNALGELAISTMTVTVLLGGVWWALSGDLDRLSAGQVVAMVFLVSFFVRPLQFLVQSLGEAQNALTGWRRALELITTPSAEVHDGAALPDGPVDVRVEHVSARYGTGPLVLHDVTVCIRPGEHIAVVGRTGSGKSTFAKLLTRRLEPATGAILLNGVPLDRLTDASLSGRVVVVPQDPFLFDDTLGRNITLGVPGATGDDARRVLHDLGLREWFADLPQGLDTPVGLRGERLSVGERQLVALARTALVDPDLVVLDEATSGVDPATDVAVQRALAVLTRDRTTVSIAHRMITAATADRVLVFAAGRLVQSGVHAVLVGEPGPYADLVAASGRRPDRRARGERGLPSVPVREKSGRPAERQVSAPVRQALPGSAMPAWWPRRRRRATGRTGSAHTGPGRRWWRGSTSCARRGPAWIAACTRACCNGLMHINPYGEEPVRLALALVADPPPTAEALARRCREAGFVIDVAVRPADLTETLEFLGDWLAVVDAPDDATRAERLNALLQQAAAYPRLSNHAEDGWHLHYRDADLPLAGALRALISVGTALHLSGRGMHRLGRCSADGCAKPFADLSRTGRQRYCSPACGNRDAVRRHRSLAATRR